jgi:Ca2+:H+ antiporter
LRAGEIEVVQSSMLGSILSNLLLVMGMCFFLGGIYNMTNENGEGIEQEFTTGTAQSTCSLMALSSGSLVLPAALYNSLGGANDEDKQASILLLSRGTAIILLLLYVLYLYFQLRTHSNLFDPEQTPSVHSNSSRQNGNGLEDDDEEKEELLGRWTAMVCFLL